MPSLQFKTRIKPIIFITALVIFAGFALSAKGQEMFSPGRIDGEHREHISKCSACHLPFSGTPDKKCLSCHKRVASQKKKYQGLHGGVIGSCINCHQLHKDNQEAGNGVTIDKNSFSHGLVIAFGLNQHRKQSCSSCHKQGYRTVEVNACLYCHSRRARGRGFANHIQALGSDCLKCHDGRSAPKFQHSNNSSFFVGEHKNKECDICHNKSSYTAISTECQKCHRHKHKTEAGDDCQNCHTPKSWKSITFNHKNEKCADCHSAPARHREKIAINAAANCQNCHTLKGWKNITFVHQNRNCTDCHSAPANHFGNSCRACHNVKNWREANINHPRLPGEAGEKHSWRSYPCQYCHPSGYSSYSCLRCHRSNNVFDDDD